MDAENDGREEVVSPPEEDHPHPGHLEPVISQIRAAFSPDTPLQAGSKLSLAPVPVAIESDLLPMSDGSQSVIIALHMTIGVIRVVIDPDQAIHQGGLLIERGAEAKRKRIEIAHSMDEIEPPM